MILDTILNPYGFNHLASFDEIFNETIPRSTDQGIFKIGLELESAVKGINERELNNLGYNCQYDGSIGESLHCELWNNSYSANSDNGYTGEIKIGKKGLKEAIKMLKPLYLDYKIIGDHNCSMHYHISTKSKEAYKKLCNINFYNYFLDFCDYFINMYDFKPNHQLIYRISGRNESYAKRGFNFKQQIRMRDRYISPTRYYLLNYCYFVPMHNRKRLHTMENRSAPLFKHYISAKRWVISYYAMINKWLSFYKDVSSYKLSHDNNYYKRSDKLYFDGIKLKLGYDQDQNDNEIFRNESSITVKEYRDQHIDQEDPYRCNCCKDDFKLRRSDRMEIYN